MSVEERERERDRLRREKEKGREGEREVVEKREAGRSEEDSVVCRAQS